MKAFAAKRVSGAELAQQISGVTHGMPSAAPLPPSPPAAKPQPTVQINFKATEAFACLVAREAEKEGSTRRLFARLMRKAGYEVPEADVNPPETRRRRGQDS